MEVPEIEADVNFIGTGDLFAALFLAWSTSHPNELQVWNS